MSKKPVIKLRLKIDMIVDCSPEFAERIRHNPAWEVGSKCFRNNSGQVLDVQIVGEEAEPEKFVIAFDTICDGNLCSMTEDDKGNDVPLLFDTYDEAFKDMFEDALCSIKENEEEQADEKMLEEMTAIHASGDVERMKEFWNLHDDECNPYNEWVESTRTFLLNRKAIYTGNGGHVEGQPIKTA